MKNPRKSNSEYIAETNAVWQAIVENNLEAKVRELLSDDHSFGMILDYLRLYNPNIVGELTLQRFKKMAHKAGLNCNGKACNAKPNAWKLQYRYTPEETKKQSRDGQVMTIALRRGRKSAYNPPQSVDYWRGQGLSTVEAEAACTRFKRTNSPRCVEFYSKQGLTLEQAQSIISVNAAVGALASLHKTQKPYTEKTIQGWLDENGIRHTTQLRLSRDGTLGVGRRSVFYLYDFFLPDHNLLIEVQGTYWHADPTIFKAEDVLSYPGGQKLMAKFVWEADEQKRQNALRCGYGYATIWERDIKSGNYRSLLKDAVLRSGRQCH